jgi:hypothetical protein
MARETQLDAVGDAAGVRLDACLARPEDDPDLARSVVGLVAGRLAIGKVPQVGVNDRAAVP